MVLSSVEANGGLAPKPDQFTRIEDYQTAYLAYIEMMYGDGDHIAILSQSFNRPSYWSQGTSGFSAGGDAPLQYSDEHNYGLDEN